MKTEIRERFEQLEREVAALKAGCLVRSRDEWLRLREYWQTFTDNIGQTALARQCAKDTVAAIDRALGELRKVQPIAEWPCSACDRTRCVNCVTTGDSRGKAGKPTHWTARVPAPAPAPEAGEQPLSALPVAELRAAALDKPYADNQDAIKELARRAEANEPQEKDHAKLCEMVREWYGGLHLSELNGNAVVRTILQREAEREKGRAQ